MATRTLTIVLGMVLIHAAATAQAPSLLGTIHGADSPEALGSQNALAGLGDVDLDGVPDFVAGAPSWPMPNPAFPTMPTSGVGKARLISGATMTQLWDVTGTTNLQAMGKAVANVGDLDGDGRNDFAVGAPMFGPPPLPGMPPAPPPQVQVWSSGAGTLLHTLLSGGGVSSSNFGVAIAGVGDVGAIVSGFYSAVPDGKPDILVGASFGNAAGVYSGADGALLYPLNATTINPPVPTPPFLLGNDDFGGTVAAAGDVTGDSIPDLLVCARLNALGGTNAGALFVLSGAGGAVVHLIQGAAGDTMGQCAAGLGDVTGDSIGDFVAGATKTDVGGADTGSITCYSGATGLPVWTTHGLVTLDSFGFAASPVGDVTGDGKQDLIVGTPTTDVGASNTGSATLLDGATGARLGTIDGLQASDLMGRAVSGLGDADADGTPDVLVAAPSADVGGNGTGTVSVVSFGPYLRPAAAGTLPAPGGGTFDMIRINGTGGGAPRRVDVPAFSPFTISFEQPPTFAFPAPLYCFCLSGIPLPADQTLAPGIGTLYFLPPLLSPADPRLFLFSDSFFQPDPTAIFPVSPLGAWSIPVPGVLPPLRIAFSGITAEGLIYVTNTVLLNIE